MKNKFVLFLAHLITTIIATVILIASIKSLIGNISLQKKIVKANAQTLQSEVNAPAYFQLRGITMLTPAMITNYDQKFGTNLRSKITWQSSGTHVEKKKARTKRCSIISMRKLELGRPNCINPKVTRLKQSGRHL